MRDPDALNSIQVCVSMAFKMSYLECVESTIFSERNIIFGAFYPYVIFQGNNYSLKMQRLSGLPQKPQGCNGLSNGNEKSQNSRYQTWPEDQTGLDLISNIGVGLN